MEQEPGAIFEATYECGVSGLAGTMKVAINDNQNNVVFGPTALGIVELTAGGTPTGTYRGMLTAPADFGQFSIIWSNDGTFIPAHGIGEEDLIVADLSLQLPSLGGDVDSAILCSAWTTSEDALSCCPTDNIGSDVALLDAAIVAASETLYLASGKQFPGVCQDTVRPCRTDACRFGWQVLSRGHLVGWEWGPGYWGWGGYGCGCKPVSRVMLSGHVRSITQVMIDGVVIAPSEYFVYRHSELVRKNGKRWPRCQSLDVEDNAKGAFAVTYEYGKAPPVTGQLAAARLACEIIKSCRGDEDCALPNGVVRITRQGITVERNFFVRQRVGVRPGDVVWATGIGEVDLFLNTQNPRGLLRTSTFWSPAARERFAEPHPL